MAGTCKKRVKNANRRVLGKAHKVASGKSVQETTMCPPSRQRWRIPQNNLRGPSVKSQGRILLRWSPPFSAAVSSNARPAQVAPQIFESSMTRRQGSNLPFRQSALATRILFLGPATSTLLISSFENRRPLAQRNASFRCLLGSMRYLNSLHPGKLAFERGIPVPSNYNFLQILEVESCLAYRRFYLHWTSGYQVPEISRSLPLGFFSILVNPELTPTSSSTTVRRSVLSSCTVSRIRIFSFLAPSVWIIESDAARSNSGKQIGHTTGSHLPQPKLSFTRKSRQLTSREMTDACLRETNGDVNSVDTPALAKRGSYIFLDSNQYLQCKSSWLIPECGATFWDYS
ncbi:hypothetical protein B0H14DRAFT_2650306 [Mycena olivaceomarginata]|nr:hypothetical protein B0H14DRAFT_2650306 [Mycena olivaceomarginata]